MKYICHIIVPYILGISPGISFHPSMINTALIIKRRQYVVSRNGIRKFQKRPTVSAEWWSFWTSGGSGGGEGFDGSRATDTTEVPMNDVELDDKPFFKT